MIEVELPDGRIVDIDTDDPAQAAIAAKKYMQATAAQQQPVEPLMPEGNMFDAVVEPIQAIAGGMASQAVSGLSGIAGAVTPGPQGQGLATMQRTQQALPDFAPETQSGQRALKTVGDLIQSGVDLANFPISGLAGLAELIGGGGIDSAANIMGRVQEDGVGSVLGSSVLESTGSPALATVASMAPDIAGAVAGFTGGRIASKPALDKLKEFSNTVRQRTLLTAEGDLSPAFERALRKEGVTLDAIINDIDTLPEMADPTQAVKDLVKQKIARGDTDGALATKRIDNMGNIASDSLAEDAIKQGFIAGDVQAIKKARVGSNAPMREMLRIRQSIFGNSRMAVNVQPTDVIGRSSMARFDHIRNTANQARQELDSIASNNLKGKAIDVAPVEAAFRQQLANRDIKIDDSVFPPKLNFVGSEISKNKSAQKVVKDTLDLLSEDETIDALRAHKLKRQLDEMIDYKKSSRDGLTPTGQRIAKSIRKALNESVRAVDDDYARVNDTLSTSLTALNDFTDVLGPSIDVFADGAAKAVGRDLRGLLSNRKTQTNLENAVTQLDKVAKDLGGVFTDDIGDLVTFSATLESRFGSTKRNSISGIMEQEGARAAKQIVQGRGGMTDMAIDLAAKGVEKARKINDQEAFKSINRLLRENQ
jgi:hypothetical protein